MSSGVLELIFFCPTSKMSHDRGGHDSCRLRVRIHPLHSILLSLAGGVTDMGVGSGALLAVLSRSMKCRKTTEMSRWMNARKRSILIEFSGHTFPRDGEAFEHFINSFARANKRVP